MITVSVVQELVHERAKLVEEQQQFEVQLREGNAFGFYAGYDNFFEVELTDQSRADLGQRIRDYYIDRIEEVTKKAADIGLDLDN